MVVRTTRGGREKRRERETDERYFCIFTSTFLLVRNDTPDKVRVGGLQVSHQLV